MDERRGDGLVDAGVEDDLGADARARSVEQRPAPPTVIRCLPTVPTPDLVPAGLVEPDGASRRRSATAAAGDLRSQPGQSVSVGSVTSTVPSASSSSPSAPGCAVRACVQRPARSSAGGSRRDTRAGVHDDLDLAERRRGARLGRWTRVPGGRRAATALDERADGVRAEQRRSGSAASAATRQRVLVVAEHHHRARRPLAQRRRARRRRPRGRALGAAGSTPVERADARRPAAGAGAPCRRSRASATLAGADGVDQRVAPGPVGPGHLQVEAARGGGDDGAGGDPVATSTTPSKPHSSLSTSLQQRRYSVVVACRRRPGCTRPSPTTPPASRTISSNGARYSSRSVRSSTRASTRDALGLGVVGDEVLDGRADAAVLQRRARTRTADRAR